MRDDGFIGALVGSAMLGFIAAAVIAGLMVRGLSQQAAVDHGCAHWDAKSAGFTWNDSAKPKETP